MGAAENADYQAHCRNDHVGRPTNWSKAETDQLVKLCQRYEMRWHVIFDRWEPVKGAKHQRSLEDMMSAKVSVVLETPSSGSRSMIT